jgi:hypothetical protein
VRSAKPVGGVYVVLLSDPVEGPEVASRATALSVKHGGSVTHVYTHAVRGFAVETTEASALAMSQEAEVQMVQEAGLFTTSATQPNPPWGLDRIDQRDRPLSATYRPAGRARG